MKTEENKKSVDITQALEDSGIPFQQSCSSFIKAQVKGWRIELEEYPVSVGDMETRIDFIAQANGGAIKIVAECKLSNRKYKTWLFVKTNRESFHELSAQSVWKDSHNPDRPPQHNQAQIRREKTDFYMAFRDYQSIQGLEIKKFKQTNQDKSFALEPIQNAGHQTALSCFGLIQERWRWYSENNTSGGERYFPVIFTTAELKFAEYDPLEEETPKTYKDVPWVLYHHAVSDHIWKEFKNKFNGEDPNKRLPILIVNKQHIAQFFASVNEYMNIQ